MIEVFGYTAAWWAWLLAGVPVVGLAGLAVVKAAHHFSGRPLDDYLYCDECGCYCTDEYPCPCCAADDGPNRADTAVADYWRRMLAGVITIGEWDDGEPVTGELRAVDDVRTSEPTEQELELARQQHGYIPELAPESLAELERVPTSIFAALSDDPDLIAWDAKQQAARVWEIAHVEFPKLRAAVARDYAAAAAAAPWPLTSWEMAA